ncbi:MAG: type VI secretion system tube protein Hcp [Pirellulales bacterium]
MPKSNSKNNWFSRFFAFLEGKSARKRAGATRSRPRLEQLESRRVFAAVLLDFPGINGDATVAGATATDMELSSFQWGFSRGESDNLASLNDPINFNDLTFKRTTDSASDELYAQTALQTLKTTPAKLRLVEGGVNLLKMDLGNARLTEFKTTEGQSESGSLSFSNLAFTETSTATPRTANWNLLNGAASSSAIAGQSNIDVVTGNEGPLNIETVMQIGSQKMLIDGFSWSASLGVDMSLTNPVSGLAKGTNFKITRGVDSATAGLLGNAAAGTIIPEIKISDHSVVAGKNQVTMEWTLSNTFFAGFGLAVTNNAAPLNELQLSYGRIELRVHQFDKTTGALTNTETTTWDEAGNIVTATTDFGIANPSLVNNNSNPVISSLNFGTALGSLAYESIDWSVSNVRNLSGTTNEPTKLNAMTVTLPASQNAPAPALLGQLARRSELATVSAFEKNTLAPTSALDTFALSNVYVTGFSVENEGLADTAINFGLDFRTFTETFTDRTTPATPLVTRASFNVQTQSSTITPSFGGKTIDTNFELVITEAGVISEIPIQSAQWSVSRSVTITNSGGLGSSKPEQTTFDIEVPRGVHSPGLLAAAVRGTEIDTVSVRRFEVVSVNGTPTKRELYRWDLTMAFITGVGMHMRPGNASDEVDSLSFLPSGVVLTTPNPNVNLSDLKAHWDFIAKVGSDNNAGLNELTAGNPALRFKQNGVAEGIAIDSYQWGATLPVGNATSAGTRPLGNPNPSSLLLKASRQPSPQLLASALNGTARPQAIKLPIPTQNPASPHNSYELKVPGLLNGYSYSDAITAANPEIGFTIFVGDDTNIAELNVTPIDSTGTAGTPRKVTWNLLNDTTTNFSGFGNFQFAATQLPATTLEIAGSQMAVDSYSFGIDNALNQLVGTSITAAPLAARGTASAKAFKVTTSMDQATPGLLNAVATKSLIPEIKITERRPAPNGQLLPWREWVLTNVYVSSLANGGSNSDPQGEVTLTLNAASATAKYTTYNAASTPTTITKRLNFADIPAIAPIAVTAISTDADLLVPVVSRFTDTQLNYTITVVSGANLFDSVSLNASNQLVLNYKVGQRGIGQIRVDGLNAFGLTSSFLVNVTLEDGLSDAPAGTDKTVTFDEDTTYIIRTTDFGFTDPNDFPANAMTGVRITTLPATGSLTLNNVAVTANQTIPIASLNANQLRYRPAANAQGTNLASFTFQVQDNGASSNLDLTPNLFTFNVSNTNDAPTFTNRTVVMPAVLEDSTSHAGMLVSDIANVIADIDPGALKGIAVVSAPTTNGIWQYALNGTTWQSLTGTSTSAARLLAADATTRVRYLPNANTNGTVSLTLHAWDRVIGQAGGIGSITDLAQFRTFSTLSASLNVTVTPVNDAPVLVTQTLTLPQIDEDPQFIPGPTSGVPISSLVGGITDIDSANAQKGIAVIEVSATGGRWQFSLTNGETWNFFNAVSMSSARLIRNSAANRIRFLPNANASGQATIKFHAWDTTQGTNGGVFNISGVNATGGTSAFSTSFNTATQTILAINDAPTVGAPLNQNVASNTPLVFSTANANRLSIGDVDAGNQLVQMTITVTDGTFTLPSTAQLTFVSGANGQSTFTLNGRVGMINEALAGAFYTPNSNFFGNSSLTISVNDLGNTGFGGPLSATATVALSVALPTNAIDLGGLNATTPTIRRSGSRDGSTATPDFYTFNIAMASDVRVNLSGLSDDLDVSILNTAGQIISQGSLALNAIENVLMSALPAGTYVIAIFQQLSSAYDLTLSISTSSDDLITQATALTTLNSPALPTERLQTSSTAADQQDYYKFNVATAGALRINLSNLSQDVDFELLDSAGRVIQSASAIDNEIVNMLTPSLAVGTYYLRVFAFGGPLTSNYDLTLSANTASDDLLTNATSLGLLSSKGSDRRTGSVAVGTDLQDYYAFSGGGDIAISLSGLTSDVDLQVLDRFGRVLAQSTNSGNTAESINVNIPSGSGSIFIRVYSFLGASNYVLEARNNSNAANTDDLLSTATPLPTPLTSLTRTGSVGGSGSTGDPQDYYRFQLSTVRNVSLSLTGLTADLDIEVLDQFGNLLFFSRNGGTSSESINMTSLAIGTYYIRIYPFQTAISNYTLALNLS